MVVVASRYRDTFHQQGLGGQSYTGVVQHQEPECAKWHQKHRPQSD